MNLRRILTIGAAAALLTASAAKAQYGPTYINPNGIGGYTIIAPPSLPPVIPPPTLNPYGQDEQDEN
jgi:hypothetical protein